MSTTVQAIERAIDVLFSLGASTTELGLAEIADGVNLPKNTVHRILVALRNKSMVRQDPATQRYALHPKVLELGSLFHAQVDLITIARPFLDQLRDRFKETAVLALRTGFTFTHVAYSPSPHEHRITPVVGVQFPLHWGAFGRAILAGLAAAEVAAFLNGEVLTPATAKTITDPTCLTAELKGCQDRGVALSIGERVPGVFAFAAAIESGRTSPVGAVGLTGPESRLGQVDRDSVVRDVKAAAQSLSGAQFGHSVSIQPCWGVGIAHPLI
jgi:DNA-binding IclR family transcriptional regulator